ncbi:hypothetical protein HK105_206823 [Polyrhizophydium stewartii]|uniref:Uncharacterized protein n=1 Tax=Polyrhizophydium stewartii TaxID=2732419 RepID=A0ABR4N2B7_9FUNG
MSSSPRVSGSSLSSPSTVSALIPAKPRVIVRTLFSQDMPLAAPTSTQPHGATFNSSGAMLEHVDQLAKAAGMMPASIPSSSDASDSCAGLPGSHVLDFIEQQNPQLWDALRYQGDLDMSTLFNVVVDHLRAPTQEFTVVLVHPKVVQKSYGKEKRFFCPQPILYLVGSSWPRLFASHSARERSLRPTASVSFIDPEQPPPRASRKRQRRISGSRGRSSVEADGGNSDGSEIPDATPGSAGGSLNSRSGVWGTVEIEPRRVNLLSRTSSFGRCSPFARTAVCNSLSASFKGLYVSDSDKRKSFHLYFQINESTSSTFICCLQSKEIKVISKPSRNKSIAKSTDLTISSGDYIALFNRVRSQTVSTRYMTVSPDGMRLSSSHSPWDTFVIWLHDDPMFRARQRATKGARPSEPWRLQHLAPEPPSMDGVTEVEVQAGESSLGRSDQTQGSSGGRFDDDSSVSERTLHYGDVVILENLMTGLLTVPLILRRVDGKCLAVIEDRGSSKQGADGAPSMDASDQAAAAAATMLSIKAGDPPTKDAVSQLHKIAFQLQSQSGQYISLRDESVVVYDATNEAGVSRKQLRQDASTHADDDGEEAGDADARNRKGSFSSAGTQESATNAAAATKRSRSGSAGSRARSGGASSTPIVAEDVTEQSVWSIVGTDLVEHTFHVPVVSAALDQAGRGAHESPTALGGAPTVQQAAQSSEAGETMRQRPRSKTAAAQAAPVLQINPMPTVEALQQEAPTVLLCRGSEFGPNLWAYAGVVPAIKVVLRTSDTILVEFPCAVSVLPRPDGASEPSSPGGDSVVSDAPFGAGPEEAAHRGQGPSREGGGLEAVPLLLVRDDGVLFRTGFTVAVHEPESAACDDAAKPAPKKRPNSFMRFKVETLPLAMELAIPSQVMAELQGQVWRALPEVLKDKYREAAGEPTSVQLHRRRRMRQPKRLAKDDGSAADGQQQHCVANSPQQACQCPRCFARMRDEFARKVHIKLFAQSRPSSKAAALQSTVTANAGNAQSSIASSHFASPSMPQPTHTPIAAAFPTHRGSPYIIPSLPAHLQQSPPHPVTLMNINFELTEFSGLTPPSTIAWGPLCSLDHASVQSETPAVSPMWRAVSVQSPTVSTATPPTTVGSTSSISPSMLFAVEPIVLLPPIELPSLELPPQNAAFTSISTKTANDYFSPMFGLGIYNSQPDF